MADSGQGDEALKIVRDNEGLLPASYNLAAIYPQTGNRDKAPALLKRHFFEYERFQAVHLRGDEGRESGCGVCIYSSGSRPLRTDLFALTKDADGKLDQGRIM